MQKYLWNLFVLHKVKPLWLSKIIANMLGFIVIYPIVLHNKETALLLSLFLAAYIYRNAQEVQMQAKQDLNKDFQKDSKNTQNMQEYPRKNTEKAADFKISKESKNKFMQTQVQDFAIAQFMISCFCACLLVFTQWQIYVIQAVCGCVFLRIYDYYKPSLIGRFHTMRQNHILGGVLSAVLCGVLSGASVMLICFLCNMFLGLKY